MVAFEATVQVVEDAQVDAGGEGVDPLFEIRILVQYGKISVYNRIVRVSRAGAVERVLLDLGVQHTVVEVCGDNAVRDKPETDSQVLAFLVAVEVEWGLNSSRCWS